jgi:hypothetical protein
MLDSLGEPLYQQGSNPTLCELCYLSAFSSECILVFLKRNKGQINPKVVELC